MESEGWVRPEGSKEEYHYDPTINDAATAKAAGMDFHEDGSYVENARIGDGPVGTVYAGSSAPLIVDGLS